MTWMRNLLEAAAARIQVIVMTCHPEHYAVGDGHCHVVDLSICVRRRTPAAPGSFLGDGPGHFFANFPEAPNPPESLLVSSTPSTDAEGAAAAATTKMRRISVPPCVRLCARALRFTKKESSACAAVPTWPGAVGLARSRRPAGHCSDAASRHRSRRRRGGGARGKRGTRRRGHAGRATSSRRAGLGVRGHGRSGGRKRGVLSLDRPSNWGHPLPTPVSGELVDRRS